MEGKFVYRLNEDVTLYNGDKYDKGDIVSPETMSKIMMAYYEVEVVLIRIL